MADPRGNPAAADLDALLASRDGKDALCFVLCGAAGGGKRTLLDRLAGPGAESGSRGSEGDPAAVAYRRFETDKRIFVAIGAPGDAQDTRSLVAGAASANLALILVDARKGVVTETRRHSHVALLMGIRQAILAVDGMDAVGDAQRVFRRIAEEYEAFARALGIEAVAALPASALSGDNVLSPQGGTPWYSGPTLIDALERAAAGQRGADAGHPSERADQFAAHVVWMDARPMLPERPYLARFAGAEALARITDLAHRVDVDSMRRLAAKTLAQDEIGYCKVSLDRPVPFDPLGRNRSTGAFTLIDRYTGAALGAGSIRFALRRASNVVWQPLKLDKAARARDIGQKPCVLWLTGLPAAGKSTIADRLEQKLQALGKHTYLLDGDNVRHGLNRDLGFTDRDRVENIRRIAEVAKLMVDAGLIVIISFISPFRSERRMARDLMEADEFFEIFVDAPLEVCEARDPKGLYAKARKGEIANFTGIDSPYEAPEHPELRLDTTALSADLAADAIVRLLRSALAGAGRADPPG